MKSLNQISNSNGGSGGDPSGNTLSSNAGRIGNCIPNTMNLGTSSASVKRTNLNRCTLPAVFLAQNATSLEASCSVALLYPRKKCWSESTANRNRAHEPVTIALQTPFCSQLWQYTGVVSPSCSSTGASLSRPHAHSYKPLVIAAESRPSAEPPNRKSNLFWSRQGSHSILFASSGCSASPSPKGKCNYFVINDQ